MRLFGPYTVIFNSVDLGKTSGGIKIEFDEQEQVAQGLGETLYASWITKIEGTISLYEAQATDIIDDLIKSQSPGVLVLTGIKHKITITNVRLKYPNSFDVGTYNYSSYDLRFIALYDGSIHNSNNPIFKLEEII